MSTDDERQARLAEIRRRHRAVEENVAWAGICVTCDEQEPCDAMTLLSELDAATARAERAEDRVLRLERQVRATYGIIHEGLHGGKPTDPEHQELCERPACRNARAALAGSTGGQEREGEGE